MVLEFLGEGVRQTREPPIAKAHREVSELAVGRADMRHVGLTYNPMLLSADAFGRAVAALSAVRRCHVNLDQHGVIDIRTERALNSVQISLVTV